MTLNQLKTKANGKLVEFWDALIPKQVAYWNKHGKFFQLLVTDRVVDGADTSWEIRKPNDEKHALDVDFQFNSPVPFAVEVSDFVGGKDRDLTGFSMTATVELPNGRQFFRTRTAVPVVTNGKITDSTVETTEWQEVIDD